MFSGHTHSALLLSIALHGALIAAVVVNQNPSHKTDEPLPVEVVYIDLVPEPAPPAPPTPPEVESLAPLPPSSIPTAISIPLPEPAADGRAYMDAPPVPSAEEWAQAATYSLKNSKRYRYTWSQQVRSMMGRAYEGADQGAVRFRVEIAPNGTLAKLETLWSTSPKAEELARQAMANMPPLPPTPTGLPLVFDKTISFQPFANDVPPIYKNDCEPDPPRFRNPFVWNGQSPPGPAIQPTTQALDPEAYAECLKQLPQDSFEAEMGNDRRQLERWRSPYLSD